MMIRWIRMGLACSLLAAVASPLVQAAGVPAGSVTLPGTAIMDITLNPGTPFNSTADPITLTGVSGIGSITLDYAAEDTTTHTIAVTALSGGMYYGSYPGLGSYVFGNVPPLSGADFNAGFTNVVQNPDGSFKSGDFFLSGATFDFKFLSGPAAGLTLFTDPAQIFSFSSSFDGLPPSNGTVLVNSGDNALNVLLGSVTGPVIALSSNRQIILSSAVPEPSSVVMLGLGTLGLIGVVKRSRRSRKPADR